MIKNKFLTSALILTFVIYLLPTAVFSAPVGTVEIKSETSIKAESETKNSEASVDSSTKTESSFGVEREMKESGEKGGTEDINIGVGELQEATSVGIDVMTSGNTEARSGYMKFGDIKGESSSESKSSGNVEYEWKIEKGEKANEVDGEIVVMKETDSESSSSLNLSVCAGGNLICNSEKVETHSDLEEYTERQANEVEIVKEVRLNDSKVVVEYTQPVKLFGFINLNMKERAEVNLDPDNFGRIKVRTPWYAVFSKKVRSASQTEAEIQSRISNLELKEESVEANSTLDVVVLSETETTTDRPTEEVAFYFNKIKASFLDVVVDVVAEVEAEAEVKVE